MSLFLYLMTYHTQIHTLIQTQVHTQIHTHWPHTQLGVLPEQSRTWVQRCRWLCRSNCWDTARELLQWRSRSWSRSRCRRCLRLASPGSIQTPAWSLELPEPQWQEEQEVERRRSLPSGSSPSLVGPGSKALAIQLCFYEAGGPVTSDRVL